MKLSACCQAKMKEFWHREFLLEKCSKCHKKIRVLGELIFMKMTGIKIVEALLQEHNFKYQEEHKFESSRRWRFDFAIPLNHIAIEVEGGHMGNIVQCNYCGRKVSRTLKNGKSVYVREGGRHNSITGFRKDCEKYNAAVVLGWTVLRYTTDFLNERPMQVIDDIHLIISRKKN